MLLQRGAPEHLVPLATCGLAALAFAAPDLIRRIRDAAHAHASGAGAAAAQRRRDDRAFDAVPAAAPK